MTIDKFEKAKSIDNRIKELKECIKFGGTIVFANNLLDKSVYINSDFLDKDKTLFTKVIKAIGEDISRLEKEFEEL